MYTYVYCNYIAADGQESTSNRIACGNAKQVERLYAKASSPEQVAKTMWSPPGSGRGLSS